MPLHQSRNTIEGTLMEGDQGMKPQEVEAPISVLDMSMSLDGYIADPNDFLGGEDGERLHKWADADGESGRPSGPTGQFQDEWNAAGSGRRRRRAPAPLGSRGGGS